MTNKEAIKYLQQLYPNGGHCWLDEQRIEAISMAIDALSHSEVTKISDQEEPVSDDLEIAACQSFNSACEDLNKEDKDSATYLKEYFKELWMCAFKDGAHWKEQQIMKEAINGEVFDNYDKDICQHHLELLVDIPKKYKDGDKVKLIIIKEDCV